MKTSWIWESHFDVNDRYDMYMHSATDLTFKYSRYLDKAAIRPLLHFIGRIAATDRMTHKAFMIEKAR